MTVTELMFHAVIKRQAWTEQGVFGVLVLDSSSSWFTAEPPDRNNQPFISCIPAGLYDLQRTLYQAKRYEVWELYPVRDRTLIYVHVANYPQELAGCIAIGTQRTGRLGEWGVARSTVARWQTRLGLKQPREMVLQMDYSRTFLKSKIYSSVGTA